MPKDAKPKIDSIINEYREEIKLLHGKRVAAQSQGDRTTAELRHAEINVYNKVIRRLTNLKSTL